MTASGFLVVVPCLAQAQVAPVVQRGPPSAPSPLSPSRIDQLKLSADEAFRNNDAVRALSFLDQAYALDPQPGLLANRGLILDRLGDTTRALADFEAYLATQPPPEKRAPIETAVRRLRPQVVLASDPPGLTVTLDDGPQAAGTTPLRLELSVGAHLARFQGPNVEAGQMAFLVERGEQQAVQLHGVPKPVGGLPEARQAHAPATKTWAYISLASGVAASAVGGALVLATYNKRDDRDAAPSRKRWEALDDTAERYEIGAGTCFGIAVAALGTGVYFWLSGN